MRILKQILIYLFWIGISFVSTFGYLWMYFGPEPDASQGFLDFVGLMIYRTIIVELVPILGTIIAVSFILTDIFYLKKKLKNNIKGILIRFLMIILLTLFVGLIHYILEKVIDII